MAQGAFEQKTMPGKTVKRRGILAAAGAVVAGIVAKQAAQPVAAGVDGDVVLGGLNNTGYYTSVQSTTTSSGYAGFVGLRSTVNPSFPFIGDAGLQGFTDIDGAMGVYALTTGKEGIGLRGVATPTDGSGIGVVGEGNGAGGTGVKGMSASGFPVIGVATSGPNANAGLLGVGTSGPGVQGQSYAGHGLVGTTAATDGVHAALIGTVQRGSNAIGVRGSVSAGAVGYAAIFDGDVIINGALRVFGFPKNAAVKHPGDGTYRLLYCEESPESWFADYGAGALVHGVGAVKLDSDFAALVHTDTYHVFLTPEGESNGLYVADRTPTGFTVREQQGGTSAVAFAWRVVAKRKDIVGERLAKVAAPPPLTPVTPYTVLETPAIKLERVKTPSNQP